MATKQDFAKFMVTLGAAIPRFAPNTGDANVLETWYAELGHLHIDKLRMAYKAAIASYDSFPSIRQVLELVGEAIQSDDDKGREVGERIWSAISKFGSVNGFGSVSEGKRHAISEYVGSIGAQVIHMQGGWNHVCEIATNDNSTTLKAQWRELAAVIVRKGGSGEAPTFDRLSPHISDSIKMLADKFDITT